MPACGLGSAHRVRVRVRVRVRHRVRDRASVRVRDRNREVRVRVRVKYPSEAVRRDRRVDEATVLRRRGGVASPNPNPNLAHPKRQRDREA